MSYFNDSNTIIENSVKRGGTVLDESQGCVNGCKAGITTYSNEDYKVAGVHDDQEGFYVVSGTGYAKFGDEECKIIPGITMIAPAGVPHQIKADSKATPVVVFWFHAAV